MFQSLPIVGTRWRAAALGLLLTGAAALPAHAQFPYRAGNAVITTSSYSALGAAATSIAVASNDDANSAPQSIGFTFNYGTQAFTQFVLNTNGFIKLGAAAPSATDLYYADPRQYTPTSALESTDPADVNIIAPFNFDLEPGTGAVGFKMATTGTTPNRVCTIEWANVSDKAFTVGKQHSNMSFQVKLYETGGTVEFVYGTFTPRTGATAAYQGAPAGLIGAMPVMEAVVIDKPSTGAWNAVLFQDTLYRTGQNRLNFRGAVRPVSGLTYRFSPVQANDMSVSALYSLGQLPIPFGAPHAVQALVINKGINAITSLPVTLTVSGVTTFTNTQTLTNVASGDTIMVTFAGYTPTATGMNTLTVTVPADDNTANNSQVWMQEVTNDTFNYASAGPADNDPLGNRAIFANKYTSSIDKALLAVKVFISNDPTCIGKSVSGVLVDAQGIVLATGNALTITAADTGAYHTFTFASQPAVPAGEFYVGMKLNGASVAFYPFGTQNEKPARQNTYYALNTAGGLFDLGTALPYRLMIAAVLGTPSTCPAPANLEILNVTATSADASFDPVAGGLSYTVFYGPAGFTPGGAGSQSATGTNTTISLTGLTSSTAYDVYVRTNCSATVNSINAGPVSFTTSCAASVLAAPFTQNFDTTPTGVLPCGWSMINANADTAQWRVINGTAAGVGVSSPPNTLRIETDRQQAKDDWVVTPGVQLTAGLTYVLTFQHRAGNASAPESLEVMVGTAPTVAALTTSIFDDAAIVVDAFPNVGRSQFTAPTTGVFYFGFHAYTAVGGFRLYLDDIALSAGVSCAAPTQIAVSNQTTNSATVTFGAVAGALNYTIFYGLPGFTPGGAGSQQQVVTTPTAILTGLAAGVSYDVYVRTNCTSTSASANAGPVGFSTTANCSAIVTTFPYVQSFEGVTPPALPCFTSVVNDNNDAETWKTIAVLPRTGTNSLRYNFVVPNGADDWFFTPGFQLTAGAQLAVNFWYRIIDPLYLEGLEVQFGSAPTVTAMTSPIIFSNTSIGNATAYEQGTAVVAGAPGTYYIGFHCVSTPDRYRLHLDDITVERGVVGVSNATLARAVGVYPNPSTGKVNISLTETGATRVALRVLDNLGRVVYTGSMHDNAVKSVDLSNLSNGLYTVQVTLDDQVVTKQVSIRK